jgi:hypothetical protein
MNKLLLALAAACFAVVLAMPVHAETRAQTAGLDAGNGVAPLTDVSSRRHWRGRHWHGGRHWRGGRHWGYRRAYWGPRRYWW